MAKRSANRGRTGWIVTALVVLVAFLCVRSSWQDKNAPDDAPETEKAPVSEFFGGLLENFSRTESDDEIDPDVDEPEEPSNDREVEALTNDLSGAKLEVHFIDVGQAESILIKAPKANVLIDAGERSEGDLVVRYLKSAGVKKLDYVIGTHPHADHIGGLATVLSELNVKKVILPDIPEDITPTTQVYTKLLQTILDEGLSITPATPGKAYDLGDGAELRILGPVSEYSSLNNMSVVARLSYGETSFLFTGDAETGAESDLLDTGAVLSTDVLSVGHHGSETSTEQEFLNKVLPRIAIISCGMDNSYGHPHREVMERLDTWNVRVLRTDLNGSIVVASDGRRLAITTEK